MRTGGRPNRPRVTGTPCNFGQGTTETKNTKRQSSRFSESINQDGTMVVGTANSRSEKGVSIHFQPDAEGLYQKPVGSDGDDRTAVYRIKGPKRGGKRVTVGKVGGPGPAGQRRRQSVWERQIRGEGRRDRRAELSHSRGPAIIGTVRVSETVTADTSGIFESDGRDDAEFGYQWMARGVDIQGATRASYTMTEDEKGKAINLRVSFTGDRGNAEELASAPTAPSISTNPSGRGILPTRAVRMRVSLRFIVSPLTIPLSLSPPLQPPYHTQRSRQQEQISCHCTEWHRASREATPTTGLRWQWGNRSFRRSGRFWCDGWCRCVGWRNLRGFGRRSGLVGGYRRRCWLRCRRVCRRSRGCICRQGCWS